MPHFFPLEARFPQNFSEAFLDQIDHVQAPLNPLAGNDPLTLESLNTQAHHALSLMLSNGAWTRPSNNPMLVGYQCEFRGDTQRGLIGLCDAAQIGKEILPHEDIRQERAQRIEEWQKKMQCQWTPVFLSYRHDTSLTHLLNKVWSQKEHTTYGMKDGSRISLWPITDTQFIHQLLEAVRQLPSLYIADGHHRAGACQNTETNLGFHPMLSVLVSDRDLRVYPFYRRILNDQSPLPFWDILDQLKLLFRLKPCSLEQMFYQYLPAGHFLLVHRDACWLLQPLHPVDHTLSDVQWLQDLVLGPVCGITDPSSDPRLDFGSMNIPLEAFKKIVHQAKTEFILVPRAPSPEEVFRTADRGDNMPPKSTSFEPKIPSGLVAYFEPTR